MTIIDYEPGKPCGYCGVRPDVACRHRRTVEPPVERPEPKPDGRRLRDWTGQGLNFRVKKPKPSTLELGEMERAWLKATPTEEAVSSGKIVRRAGVGTASMFGAFASKHQELFVRLRDGHNSYSYRLSEEGAERRRQLDAQP